MILCMIFLFSGLFYEYDKTINQYLQIKNYFHFLILLFHAEQLVKKGLRSLLIMSSVSLPDLNSSLSLHTKKVRVSPVSLE